MARREDDLYAFLTCEANAEVADVHPKAMPVILTDTGEWQAWMIAPWAEAKKLHLPLAGNSLTATTNL